MNYKRFAKILLYALAMVVMFAALAVAEEHGGAGEETTVMDWVWRVLNFGIIIGVLIYFLARPLRNFMKKRIEDIQASLAEARAAREESMRRLSEVEAKLKDKDRELKSILDVAQESGQKEKALLVKESEKMGEDILASAKENIDAELLKAREALRREAALLAIELAEKMVKENIKKEDQARILEEYLAKVGGK